MAKCFLISQNLEKSHVLYVFSHFLKKKSPSCENFPQTKKSFFRHHIHLIGPLGFAEGVLILGTPPLLKDYPILKLPLV
jgi:hypothetical protein